MKELKIIDVSGGNSFHVFSMACWHSRRSRVLCVRERDTCCLGAILSRVWRWLAVCHTTIVFPRLPSLHCASASSEPRITIYWRHLENFLIYLTDQNEGLILSQIEPGKSAWNFWIFRYQKWICLTRRNLLYIIFVKLYSFYNFGLHRHE